MGEAVVARDHVLLTLSSPEPKELLERFRRDYPHIDFTYKHIPFTRFGATIRGDDELDELYRRATIICTQATVPDPEQVKHVKFIHFTSAGVDHFTTQPLFTKSNIPLTTSSGIAAPTIAEWAVLQILSNSHKQKVLLEWQKQHIWGKHTELGGIKDAVGTRIGILGYGSIGRQTARACKALGMDVVAFTASPRTTPASKHDQGYIVPGTGDTDGSIPSAWYSGLDKASLHAFLALDLDILLVSVPLTPLTRHLLGADEFRILGKRNALVINISRGPILVQDDLIEACRKELILGGLRGAALDVTDPEPLPSDSALWDLPNVAITPHVSGLSVDYIDRSLEVLEINLERETRGGRLLNLVDRRRGY